MNVGNTSKVCAYPDGNSPYGACDMAGNVNEWANDWYNESYYGKSPSANPQGAASGEYRVLRSGSWNANCFSSRAANRYWGSTTNRYSNIGFRCCGGAS